ncbi:molecular chaperone TorD family protein [Roseibium salinum]|nr:molecular chaperone TorD family protein [Roseibium salinum]
MAERRIERAEGKHEPEDNIASLMEMMGGMIVGRFGKVTSVAGQKSFFQYPYRTLGHSFLHRSGSEQHVRVLRRRRVAGSPVHGDRGRGLRHAGELMQSP